ncbi:MAG: adenosine deaminase [Terriglobia bacterium]|nr:adenosine deaminase [Terriglobia bacterium]
MRARRIALSLVLVACSSFASAQQHPAAATPAHPAPPPAAPTESPEQRTEKAFDAARQSPPALYAFLREMPKGGDLHNHMTGAVYAESYVRFAAENNLCVDRKTMNLTAPPCKEGQAEAKEAFSDPILYREMLAAWSMLGWPMSGKSGHDQFFDAFPLFDKPEIGHYGDMLAELAQRNADANVQYLELMLSPDVFASLSFGLKAEWNDDFGKMRTAMLDGGLRDIVAQTSKNLDQWEARRDAILHCRDSNQSLAEPGCSVKTRYIFQILRGFPKQAVFAQLVTAFETATQDPRVVGLNLVMPEDAYIPMHDFELHMRMLSYLKEIYPKVHITLHAGELAPGLVPPDGLRNHIRDSIEIGRAERIGHGVDIMYEDNPHQLLAEMARRNIMVEICLTSNDMILGVKGKNHPLAQYLKAGVPVALATDDEGVARSEITREFMKGVYEQDLDYLTLKRMVRTSIEHAFLPGQSLWQDGRRFVMGHECAADRPNIKSVMPSCQKLLNASEKAREEWKVEQKFAEFEAKY